MARPAGAALRALYNVLSATPFESAQARVVPSMTFEQSAVKSGALGLPFSPCRVLVSGQGMGRPSDVEGAQTFESFTLTK